MDICIDCGNKSLECMYESPENPRAMCYQCYEKNKVNAFRVHDLRAELDAAREELAGQDQMWAMMGENGRELEARNNRLRKALEAVEKWASHPEKVIYSKSDFAISMTKIEQIARAALESPA